MSARIPLSAEHWLVRVTDLCSCLGESPGSKPRFRVPIYVGQIAELEDDVEEVDATEDEAEEEDTEIMECGRLPIPRLLSIKVVTDPLRRRGALCSRLMLMDLSLIWFLLGRISKHGLLPIPMEDISWSLIVLLRRAWRHSSLEISSVQASFISVVGDWTR